MKSAFHGISHSYIFSSGGHFVIAFIFSLISLALPSLMSPPPDLSLFALGPDNSAQGLIRVRGAATGHRGKTH